MTAPGAVQRAVRAKVAPGSTLTTFTRGKPFVVERVDGDGIVLLLEGRWRTPLPWECIEGVAAFLHGRDWVEIGSKYDVGGDSNTLDGYLKGYTKTATANWVARVLEKAKVVELDGGRPLRIRLKEGF